MYYKLAQHATIMKHLTLILAKMQCN